MTRSAALALFMLLSFAAAAPAAADLSGVENTDATLADARREARRAAVHDVYDARARELGRREFDTPGGRAEAWRRLEDERRAALAALDRPRPTPVSRKR